MEKVAVEIDALVEKLRESPRSTRPEIYEQIRTLCAGPDGERARSRLETLARRQVLEIQWELEDIVESTTPAPPEADAAPEPEPAPEPEAAPPNSGQLTSADLDMVYDDPRGLVLHKTKAGPERWFATQVDPRTSQPQTFELQTEEITQLKAQLAGSPYWALGHGPTS